MITSVNHIGLTVRDLERSIRFYRDVLGLRLLGQRIAEADYVGKQTGHPGVRLAVASFQLGAQDRPTLELAQYLNHAAEGGSPLTNSAGQAHLCCNVADLRAAYTRLREQEVKFRSEPVHVTAGPNRGGLVVYLYDPDGFTVELFQPPAPNEGGQP